MKSIICEAVIILLLALTTFGANSVPESGEPVGKGEALFPINHIGRRLNSCGASCNGNVDCQFAADGCIFCNGISCYNPSPPQCGSYCFDHTGCQGAIGGCTTCDQAARRCFNANVQQCGSYCEHNSQCSSGLDGCTLCNGFDRRCYNSGSVNRCNVSCSSNADCSNANDGCTVCNSNFICAIPTGDRTCIGDEGTLSSVINQANNQEIFLCTGTITITSEIIVSTSGITLLCAGGERQCTLSRSSATSGRIMTFNRGSITIDSIVFQNGNVSGNGGAIVFNGSNNVVTRCAFNNNRASGGRGGAVYSPSFASFLLTYGSGTNSASQCNDAFNGGSCVTFMVGG